MQQIPGMDCPEECLCRWPNNNHHIDESHNIIGGSEFPLSEKIRKAFSIFWRRFLASDQLSGFVINWELEVGTYSLLLDRFLSSGNRSCEVVS